MKRSCGLGLALLFFACSKSNTNDPHQDAAAGSQADSGSGATGGGGADASAGSNSAGTGGSGATGASGGRAGEGGVGTGGSGASAGTGGSKDGGIITCDGGVSAKAERLYPYNNPEWGRGVFVDETMVYWASNLGGGTLRKAAKPGGGTPVSLGHSDLSGAPSLVADAEFVYFLTAGTLRKFPQGGGSEGTVLSEQTGFTEASLHTDGKSLFMAKYCCTVMGRIEKDGTGLISRPVPMAVNGGGVCGTGLNDTGFYCSDGPRIFSMPLDASEPKLVHTLPAERATRALTVAGDNLYWIEGSAGGGGLVDLMTRPVTGGATMKLATPDVGRNGTELHLDAKRQTIFWAMPNQICGWDLKTKTFHSALSECEIRPLGYLAQDDSYVYWIQTNGEPGGIYRAPKDDLW